MDYDYEPMNWVDESAPVVVPVLEPTHVCVMVSYDEFNTFYEVWNAETGEKLAPLEGHIVDVAYADYVIAMEGWVREF